MQFGTSFRINLAHKKCKDPDERVDNLFAKSIIALNSATLSPAGAAQAATTRGLFLTQRTTNSLFKRSSGEEFLLVVLRNFLSFFTEFLPRFRFFFSSPRN